MTSDELEALLAEKRKEEADRKKKERAEYETYINRNTERIVRRAKKLNTIMINFLNETVTTLDEMGERLASYGEIRANSKGGFSRKTADGKSKVVYRTSTICDWDERAGKAEELLKDFLGDVVRKRDKQLFELIVGLLEKNKEGKLEFSRMQTLYAKEALFDDPRWVEAIRLFKESFRPIETKMRLEVYTRNEQTNKWEPVVLNLSSL